ncbi:MAG: hypothetical protein IPP13_06090 [Kouleothrix sp.]|nr:hypothetical protein [Kouleothrix sp.]
MSTIPQVSQAMQELLTSAAEAADAKLHYTKRPDRAKFTAATLTQTLVLGFLAHPDARVEQLAQSAARVGVAVAPQAVDQRFTLATAALLQDIVRSSMHTLIAADGVAIPLLQRFTGVRVHDSTTIVLPDALAEHWRGCGGASEVHTSAALSVVSSSICSLGHCAGLIWRMVAPPTIAWASSMPRCPRAACAWPTWAFMTWACWPR